MTCFLVSQVQWNGWIWGFQSSIWISASVPSLKLIWHLKSFHPKRKVSSKHQFSGAVLVSGRVSFFFMWFYHHYVEEHVCFHHEVRNVFLLKLLRRSCFVNFHPGTSWGKWSNMTEAHMFQASVASWKTLQLRPSPWQPRENQSVLFRIFFNIHQQKTPCIFSLRSWQFSLASQLGILKVCRKELGIIGEFVVDMFFSQHIPENFSFPI